MAEPLSLAVLSGAALTEGIHFLYDQAGAALEHRRDRRKTPNVVTQPPALGAPDEARVRALEEQIRALRNDLHDELDRGDIAVPVNMNVLLRADALRAVLESAYRTRLVFTGENRAETDVFSDVEVDDVRGYVAAIRSDIDVERKLNARMRIRRVAPGAEAIGVDLRRGKS